MSDWIKSSEKKPPQGKKVLCFNNGDVDVRQRFRDKWFPIPYVDSKFSNLDEPEFWQDVELPENYTGMIRMRVGDRIYTMDELELAHPNKFEELLILLLSDCKRI